MDERAQKLDHWMLKRSFWLF